jgi:hypothetical protein
MKKLIIILLIILLSTNAVIPLEGTAKVSNKGDWYRFKLIPEDEGFLDSADSRVTYSVVVNVSASYLWKNIINQHNWTKWLLFMNKCELVTPPPIGLHSKRIIQVIFIKFYEDIVIWQPERAFGFTILEANVGFFTRAVEAVYLEPVDENSTRLTYRGGFEFRGIFNLIKNMIERVLVHYWTISFEELAKISKT